MKYSCIYIDVPWRYADKGCNGAADKQYSTMTIADLKALPIASIMADNCVMFMWATWPLLPEALDLIKSWGLAYKSIGFVWLKCNKRNGEAQQYRLLPEDQLDHFYGLGRWTRGNTEPCLLAVRGKPKRISKDVHQVVYAPVSRHSEKPGEVRDRIVRLIGDVPRIEIFAREVCRGWTSLGNGIDGKDIRVALKEIIAKPVYA